jgi:methylated-DNA-[protein]-cysteine S-methyltransferase
MKHMHFNASCSYAALAARLHTSPRAVGRAVGRNPILLIVPCHRVIGKDGSPTGYAGGLARKEALLAAERTEGRTPEK